MKNKTVVILGSARSFGNTRKVIDALLVIKNDIDVIDLNDFNIGYYDYGFKNSDDDFLGIIQNILQYESIIFATPVYWYSMSAQLKTFFDRISDLLHGENKVLGRQLRGKQMAAISCGSDDEIKKEFEMPFKESANYLGMKYINHIHTWVEAGDKIPDKVAKRLKSLVKDFS
ncbi:MAG: NAD(P)H-dependent oxidoreductase [Flavobacteriaceae bacterium]